MRIQKDRGRHGSCRAQPIARSSLGLSPCVDSEVFRTGDFGGSQGAGTALGPLLMQWTAPTTGIAVCHRAVALEQQRKSAYGY